jgi:tetraacyldisaccharide-1-P 4'-kinase
VIFTRAEQSKLPVNTMPKLPPFAVYLANSNLLGFRRFRASDQQKTLRQSLAGVYFAFCGIGNPEAFFVDLERWGVRVAGRRTFRDHHHYTPSEMDNLQRAAQRAGATGLVTTEKDAQNMDESMVLNMPVEMALFAIEIPEEQEFLRNLYNRLPVTVGAVAS